MADENNTPVEPTEETPFERAQRKLAEAESALFAPAQKNNKHPLDGAIGQEL